jgi:hypothetical protein
MALDLALGGAPSAFAADFGDLQALMPAQPFAGLMNPLSGPASARPLTLLGGDKAGLKLAALLQFTLPGAPALYYGDEVGLSGAAGPDSRRTYPWADLGGSPDLELYAHFRHLIGLRRAYGALRGAGMQVVLADDAHRLLAYVRADGPQTAVVALNTGALPQTAVIPVAAHLAEGAVLTDVLNLGGAYTVTGGTLAVPLSGRSGAVLIGDASALPPVVAFAQGALFAAEGAGPALVPVTVSGSHTRTITVTYATLPGSAGPADFEPAAGTLTFPPGQTTRTFAVTLIDDGVIEPNETLALQLSAPVNALLGSPAQAVLTILDDDNLVPPGPRVLLPVVGR